VSAKRKSKAAESPEKSETKAGATIRIEQIRSPICTPPAHRDALRSLGLRRIRHVVEREDSPAVRGLVHKIPHLVRVIED
jgi:large subunit ribosomal protein L30